MTATQAANVQARANIGDTTLTLATSTGTCDVLSITAGLGATNTPATSIPTLNAACVGTNKLFANPDSTQSTGAR